MKPGSPISVSAKVRRNQAPVAAVTLLVRINYAPEQQLPMTASGSPGGSFGCASWQGSACWVQTIPLKWHVDWAGSRDSHCAAASLQATVTVTGLLRLCCVMLPAQMLMEKPPTRQPSPAHS